MGRKVEELGEREGRGWAPGSPGVRSNTMRWSQTGAGLCATVCSKVTSRVSCTTPQAAGDASITFAVEDNREGNQARVEIERRNICSTGPTRVRVVRERKKGDNGENARTGPRAHAGAQWCQP